MRAIDNYLGGIVRAMAYALRSSAGTLPAPGRAREQPSLPGAPRLTRDEAGAVRCVACFLCAAACPSRCLELEAGEENDGGTMRRGPVRFDIDLGRCILCGFCVQACPEDAIDMGWGRALPLASAPQMLVIDKPSLLAT